MGKKERVFSPLPRDVSLEDLVPKDNFYRRLDGALDLLFVRELVRPLYAKAGRPSVDPVVFFKLQLVMFFKGIRSERELMRVAADRLSVRWYLGYDLHESLPDHSNLTRTRERFGVLVFRRFFERIVERCAEAGLVWGEELFFDATKVRADADVDSLHSRAIVENHLKGLFVGDAETKLAEPPSLRQSHTSLPTHGVTTLREANVAKRDWISRNGRQDRAYRSGSRTRTADRMVSTTDPDATPMPFGEKTRLGYQANYVVDGGKARIILNALVTPFEVTENRPMLDLLFGTVFRHNLRPRRAVGDATYGTLHNIKGIEEAGIWALVPVADFTRRTRFFGKDRFTYDPKEDAYTCPAGEVLGPQGRLNKDGLIRYRASAKACAACSLKSDCTDNKQGRAVHRHPEEHYLEIARAHHQTEAYEKAMRKRKVWAEPPFAEAKRWHGMDRFRLRGLERVNAEALLVAAGQNIKKLLLFGDWKPRKLPEMAALRPPVAAHLGSRRFRRPREAWPRGPAKPILQHSGQLSCSPLPYFARVGATLPAYTTARISWSTPPVRLAQ